MLDGKNRIGGAMNDEKRRLHWAEPALHLSLHFSMNWFAEGVERTCLGQALIGWK